jgi:hypothetical protein
MGLAQPLPTVVNLAEQQARWVAMFLAGEYALPSEREMEATIRRDEEREIGGYYKSRRHTQQLNFDRYCAELKREMARGKRRAAAQGLNASNRSVPPNSTAQTGTKFATE